MNAKQNEMASAAKAAPVTKTGYELKNGDVVYVQGFLMTVKNVRLEKFDSSRTSPDVIRFEGVCTDDKRNDSIRRTSYNGGTYGQLARLSYAIGGAL